MPATPAPRRLGSTYVLDERIGAGAQGEVWRGRRIAVAEGGGAHAASQADETLAFKLLRADLVEDAGVVDRFIKERSTLLRVRSPYVVAIRDVVIEGSTFAIAMDHVSGGDLKGLLREHGPLAPAEVARVGADVATGLAAVHAAGVVHRDVKPANILMDSATTPPTPRVADFGVARICDTVASSHVTGVMGTPLYMAPEILSAQVPSPAADVYSLGVVLYEASCGTPPFTGAPAQLLGQHARRAPGRPDGVPDPLWDLITAMLAKQPAVRPSAQAVAARLQAMRPALEGLPAAPRLASAPATLPSAAPYVWGEDPAETWAPSTTTASAPPSAPTGPTGYGSSSSTGAGGLAAASRTAPTEGYGTAPTRFADAVGYGAVVPGTGTSPLTGTTPATIGYTRATPSSPAPTSAYGLIAPAAPDGHVPARRRRRAWVVGVVVIAVLALVVGGAGLAWRLLRGDEVPGGWIAALPAGNSASEEWRLSDAIDVLVSPDSRLLAVESSSTWSLYDLTSSDHSAVWSGSCYTQGFWTADQFLCATSDEAVLVDATGATSAPPGPTDHNLQGTTAQTAVLIDSSYEGDLVALDTAGNETWRVYGSYDRATVADGFVLAYESDAKALQVLSVITGDVLTSVPMDASAVNWDQPLPGGFGIGEGSEAYFRVDGSTTTVYDASGQEKATVDGGSEATWVASAPVDAGALADLASGATQADGATVVRGTDRTVTVATDLGACSATVDGVSLDLPERADGEDCVITPLGLTADDSAVLVGTGTYSYSSSDTGDVVAAYSLEDGSRTWQVNGTWVAALDEGRFLVRQKGDYGDLVVASVVEK